MLSSGSEVTDPTSMGRPAACLLTFTQFLVIILIYLDTLILIYDISNIETRLSKMFIVYFNFNFKMLLIILVFVLSGQKCPQRKRE